ncbi:SRPBCC family protein [Egibacter rhizosphaerae]|uniref:SRPBCC family protein n=1 Tax=Egibacter rhizosphaerae TaxID=1670831 RepID=A0A411YAC7_9ACTN|nr:SRPBCC family protein [Egibacter rhizosphaerae]QBI18170.1 SRPBCC family protein [Egibacter rhizosphaerae]
MSNAVHDSILVAAALEEVFDVVTDLERYPEWQDEIKAVEVLETDEGQRPLRAWFRIDARLFQTTYTLAYEYHDDDGERVMSWDLVEGDKVSELDGSYRLAERDPGSTEVTYELTVTPRVKLPGLVRRQAARRIVDGALKGVKQRAEAS